MNDLSKAVIKTLCYADIFNYPLTFKELYKFLIFSKSISNNDFAKFYTQLEAVNNNIKKSRGYFFLKGRERLIEIRRQRERWARQKLNIARRVAFWLRLIPTVKMVAVTGALALNNAKEEDDIDLLIVSSAGWLWTTRLLTTILVELVAQRRRPVEQDFKNKICLNMFLDEDSLGLPKNEQDLFLAHEVMQVRALWDRGEVYEKFIMANRWVSKYLPNSIFPKIGYNLTSDRLSITSLFLKKVEVVFKKVQLLYMRSRRTNEVIRKGCLRFHPKDARIWVLREYEDRLKKYGIK